MTLMLLCALTPPLCRMAADPAVRAALARLSDAPHGDLAPLAAAMGRHPEDAARAMALLGSGGPPTTESLRRRFNREALAFFHLCGQCAPEEILRVLTRCTVPPTTEALALLIGEHRREQAVRQYGLQLLWRLSGDASLPDASAFFPQAAAPVRTAGDIIRGVARRLKEADT